jgi:hypothetical protein
MNIPEFNRTFDGAVDRAFNQRQSTALRQPLVLVLAGLMGVAMSACVTINIYFPAAAAEKAAEKIVDEILNAPSSGGTTTPPVTKP